ncbi:MAG: RNA polymerase sigma factor [Planctomycetota bacterium]
MELVLRAQAGSGGAYDELVRRWAPRVLAFCRSRVRRLDDAEDLAQETLLRGYRALRSLRRPGRFGAWLRGIALRVCLDWHRSPKRSEVALEAVGVQNPDHLRDPRPGTQEELERRDELTALMREVQALPEEYREVLMLYYADDLTYRDVAETLEVSTATVNARLTKGRALLRVRLQGTRT